ncbi:MAG: ABC transporter ATP-binding protein [[Clostridium] cellulosi]
MYSVVLDSVCKSYPNGAEPLVILDNASYQFETGKFYSVVGRSGLGKTTLVSIIGTVEKADSGSVIVCDHNLSDVNQKQITEIRRKHIGFVFQNFSLIERYSVLDNLEIPLYFAGIKNSSQRLKMIKDAINSVGIPENKLQKPVSTLSGGEKQRIALCRDLINSPSVIIADEPTGNLDEENEQKIIQIFMDIKQQKNCTIIMVTHNLKIANKADVTVTLKNGKIVEADETK